LPLQHFSRSDPSVGNDGFRRILRLAHAAIDAPIEVDDEHVLAFLETIHRTGLDAIHMLALNAIIGRDEGHNALVCHGRSGR
jgi:hypothetical protein